MCCGCGGLVRLCRCTPCVLPGVSLMLLLKEPRTVAHASRAVQKHSLLPPSPPLPSPASLHLCVPHKVCP
jgi:hypothetical protein